MSPDPQDAETAELSAQPTVSAEPRRHIGSYDLLEQIGAGGMGEVYRAVDRRLNRTVAIKLLPARVAEDPVARERFEWEAKAIAALNHPHICTLYEFGSSDGIDYLVMEHLEGRPLAGPMPSTEVVRLALQIVDALDVAHQHGILHRDLKPANIVCTKSGAKLLDFGLAKSMTAADPALTASGTVWGTVSYMSPEQAEGRPLDARSDIFSFGAVLYELLSGRRAFPGQSVATILSAILRDEPTPLEGVEPALQQVVWQCLAKNPSDRFHDCAAVKASLSNLHDVANERPSIAVLPLTNLSADSENEFFCDGVAEEIINALTQVSQLRVAARSSSMAFKGTTLTIGDIASRLKVRHLVQGSVRRAGQRVRVTAQLVDASNGFQLWSERYDRQLEDIFEVQDQIARAIVDRLKVTLVGDGETRLVKVSTTDVDAYQHYVKGRVMLYRRGPWVSKALTSFQTAVTLDPDFAQAWALIAEAYTALSYMGALRPDHSMPAALRAATRAVKLDPLSAEGHAALALVELLWRRDFNASHRAFLEALRLNPHFVHARALYAVFLLQFGLRKDDEGLEQARFAAEGDPHSSFAATMLSFAFAVVRQFDDALAHSRRALELDPDSFLARWQASVLFNWMGRFDDATEFAEPLWKTTNHVWAGMALMPAYWGSRRRDEADAVYKELLERQQREYVPPMSLAVCAATRGDIDDALDHLERGIAIGDTTMALTLRFYYDLDPVRAHPRFEDIARRFNTR